MNDHIVQSLPRSGMTAPVALLVRLGVLVDTYGSAADVAAFIAIKRSLEVLKNTEARHE